ncbi:hypothetical protein [Streptomyces sp. NPDC002644]
MADEIETQPQDAPEVDEGQGGTFPPAIPAPEGPTVDELQEQLAAGQTALSEVTARAESAEKELARLRVAYRFQLPEELASRLRGNTEEEMAADAKALAKYAQRGSIGLGIGGLDPLDAKDSVADVVARVRNNPL